MGLMRILSRFFGGGRNVVAETVGVFREHKEAGAQRRADYAQAALGQFSAEFAHARKGGFDRFMDGLNRLPRPLIVLATFALFALVVIDPIRFTEIMVALDLVPEPLWWLMGTIVTFYFGGRMQEKLLQSRQEFGRVAQRLPAALEQIQKIRELSHDSPGAADTGTDATLELAAHEPSENAAVRDWQESVA